MNGNPAQEIEDLKYQCSHLLLDILDRDKEIDRLRDKILDLEMTRRLDAQIQSHIQLE